MTELLTPVIEIVANLGALAWVLLGWLVQWWIVVAWFAWWLWGVDWSRVWPVLARGGWVVVLLLVVVAALAWSEIAPRESEETGLSPCPISGGTWLRRARLSRSHFSADGCRPCFAGSRNRPRLTKRRKLTASRPMH